MGIDPVAEREAECADILERWTRVSSLERKELFARTQADWVSAVRENERQSDELERLYTAYPDERPPTERKV